VYPQVMRVGSTPLLAKPEWLPPAPLGLDDIGLAWVDTPPPGADVNGPASAHLRPLRPTGARYPSYAEALAQIERPRLLENRPIYRLLSASLAAGPPLLRLTRGRYFDWLNGGEGVAHELADAWHADPDRYWLPERLRLRTLAGNPGDLPGRSTLSAVTTLTLRVPPTGEPTFVLHWRDPAAVTHAGGMYQVMPVGVFQPAGEGAVAEARDLDLWRGIAREFSEEFLGAAEDYDGPGDYASWPFFERLSAARAAGRLRVWCLGLGADPLAVNAEGRVMTGVPFTAGTVGRFVGHEPMQPAGAAVLELAWEHRKLLLG
jgi:hypothetical protein